MSDSQTKSKANDYETKSSLENALVDYLASKILAKILGTEKWAYLKNLGTR